MAQHFLLSKEARTLSLKSIYQAGEVQARETFKRIRWAATNGEPVCPQCGCVDSKPVKGRPTFRCLGCAKQYTITSGTIFASRKMSYTDLLAAICIFVNSVKGISALQLSRDLDCQHKTAFVLCHKLREALAAEIAGQNLEGEIEIDGAYFGGYVRPANFKKDRIDRRLAENRTGKRRVVVALRQRKGRTHTYIVNHEAEGVAIAERIARKGSVFFADEATHWDALHNNLVAHRINHSEAYSYYGGVNTNQAESFFSRLRLMVSGQHHHVSAHYLYQYANHAAWLEDHRRDSNGDNANAIIGNALNHPVSRVWSGYWQR
ncbi:MULTISPECIES: IS1595 family transposase [unclassified Mesorhizobium]|uniref:IS1595 family transposase n=1 Tax=unclassified Mesorhizobium TaxID=325217 RepID=UPI0010936DFC|nr:MULTISPECIES: IS1595 family transposase [unclassified Mesorhizobium]TGS45199.1 IS1595 family transposase [Mesorhizobium sp. M8A.F.Ca.ET.182.01.1.1]TGS80899.1 IS1595 family transposase [Mesorhizobium sp. M8A.F.Ca.ET.181.01.1.1]